MVPTLVVLPLLNILKIVDSGVIEVLAGKDNVVDVARMSVRDRVTCSVNLRPRQRSCKHTIGIISPKAYGAD